MRTFLVVWGVQYFYVVTQPDPALTDVVETEINPQLESYRSLEYMYPYSVMIVNNGTSVPFIYFRKKRVIRGANLIF